MALAGVGINTVAGFTASIKYALQSSVEGAAKEAQRLSTGNKIINAYEDAAGLVIGTGLEGEARTLKVVLRGILQGQSALYIAEGAIDSLTKITVRQKELTAAALSGVTSDKERGFIQLEYSQLNEEIDRVSSTTNFNGVHLIDGSISTKGNVVTNTQNIVGGSGTSKVTYAPITPTANKSYLDLNGVTFIYGTGVTAGATDVYQANDLRIGFKDVATSTAALVFHVGGTNVTVNIEAVAIPSAAGTITVAGGKAEDIVKNIASAINNDRDTINFGKMQNISARAEGATLVIQSGKVFQDAANAVTDANYSVETTGTTPGQVFSSFKVGANPATTVPSAAAAAVTTNITGYSSGKAVSIAAANESALVTAIANQINGGAGSVALDNYSNAILSRISATALPDNTTQSQSRLVLESKDKSLNGRILMNGFIDNAGTMTRSSSVSEYSSGTKVGSLGLSSISIGGSLLGSGAGYINNLQFANATTDLQSLNANSKAAIVRDGSTFRIGTESGGSLDFTFRQNPVFERDIQIIGDPAKNNADWQATMVNLVSKLRGSSDPIAKNLSYQLNSNSDISISSKVADDSLNGMVFAFRSDTGVETQRMTMKGGMATGLNMSNVSGTGFQGGITRSNVSAIYESPNKVTINISAPGKDGVTFSAKGVDVAAGGNVRLVSNKQDAGGSFDVQLSSGMSISNQNEAELFAATLGDALAGLTFYQTRRIDSFEPKTSASSLNGAFAEITSKSYDGKVNVSSVSVAGTQSDSLGLNRSYITLKTDDGRIFQNVFNPGETMQYLAKGQKVTLVSVNSDKTDAVPLDKNEKIEIYFGNSDIDMTNAQSVLDLQKALVSSFNAGQAPMKFQADSNVNVVIPISLEACDLNTLYDGESYNVATADSAAKAGAAVDGAIDKLLATRDKIGSYESRFNYTIQSLQSYVQNMEQARSAFLDASMPDSVEGFSKENMKTQTAISVLKQIIQTQQQLVSLVQ